MAFHMIQKKFRKTGSEASKIQNIAFPVYTTGYYGQTVGDINKIHKIDYPQIGVGLSYEPPKNWKNRK